MKTYLWFFGEIIETKRHDLGLTRKYIADYIGVDQSSIYHWERGRLQRLPRPEHYHLLCDALGLDPVEVFTECDYVRRYPQALRRWRKAA